MKKILMILILTAVCLFTAACGETDTGVNETTAADTEKESETVVSGETEKSEDNADTVGGWVFTLEDGTSITLGGAFPELGEPLSYAEAVSCIHPGMDKVYTYDGFSVTTSPDAGGNDYVSEFALISDSAVLDNGIKIGALKDVVISVFGDGYTDQFGVMQYEFGDTVISAVIEADAIISFVAAVTK